MNYDELIKKIAKKNDLEYEEAAQFIDGFFAIIKLGIANNEPVKIYKFGTFAPTTIKTKLARNKESNEIEITPDEVYPHFEYTRAKEKKGAPAKGKKKKEAAKKIMGDIPQDAQSYVQLVEQFYKKIVIVFISLLIVFSLGLFVILNYYLDKRIDKYLNEKGFTYSAVEEMVDSRFQDVISRTEGHNQEISSAISNQLNKIRNQQKASLKKLMEMEKHLKKKISSMIGPQLKKRKRKAQVKMVLYRVKKNDTLWGISKKYLKNPYNWVGIYRTNGKRIKNPDKIYPGQKIFIPVVKEY